MSNIKKMIESTLNMCDDPTFELNILAKGNGDSIDFSLYINDRIAELPPGCVSEFMNRVMAAYGDYISEESISNKGNIS